MPHPAVRVTSDQIDRAARQAGIPPRVLRALVGAESGGDQGAHSPAGAIGATQLMPGTARGLGVDPYDREQNLAGGARYLAQQLKRFGRLDLALSAYNSGPAGSEAQGRVEGFPETQRYVSRILGALDGDTASVGPQAKIPEPTPAGAGGADPRRAFIARLLASVQGRGGVQAGDVLGALRQSRATSSDAPVSSTDQAGAATPRVNGGGLAQLLQRFGVADSITSGERSPARNRAAGGSPTSYHLPGDNVEAVDLDPGDPDARRLTAYARANPGEFREFFGPFDWHIKNGRLIRGRFPDHDDHIHAAR